MDDLDLTQLQTFADVVETGSFSAAARRRALTQPAVSLRIRQLERHLGVVLVNRHGSRIRITPAGDVLYLESRRVRDAVLAATTALDQYRKKAEGKVTIGAGPSVCMYLLPPVLASLQDDHPGLEISVRAGSVADLLSLVDGDQIDIAVLSGPAESESFATRHLMDDELVLIRHKDDGRDIRTFSPAVVATLPLMVLPHGGGIRPIIDRWFQSDGLPCRPVMELASIEATKHLVEAKFGCAIIPRLALDSADKGSMIVAHSLTPKIHRPLEMVVRQDKKLTKQFREVLHAFDRLSLQLTQTNAD